jgi:hypothetical protein
VAYSSWAGKCGHPRIETCRHLTLGASYWRRRRRDELVTPSRRFSCQPRRCTSSVRPWRSACSADSLDAAATCPVPPARINLQASFAAHCPRLDCGELRLRPAPGGAQLDGVRETAATLRFSRGQLVSWRRRTREPGEQAVVVDNVRFSRGQLVSWRRRTREPTEQAVVVDSVPATAGYAGIVYVTPSAVRIERVRVAELQKRSTCPYDAGLRHYIETHPAATSTLRRDATPVRKTARRSEWRRRNDGGHRRFATPSPVTESRAIRAARGRLLRSGGRNVQRGTVVRRSASRRFVRTCLTRPLAVTNDPARLSQPRGIRWTT